MFEIKRQKKSTFYSKMKISKKNFFILEIFHKQKRKNAPPPPKKVGPEAKKCYIKNHNGNKNHNFIL
jgi:hypothetical protein